MTFRSDNAHSTKGILKVKREGKEERGVGGVTLGLSVVGTQNRYLQRSATTQKIPLSLKPRTTIAIWNWNLVKLGKKGFDRPLAKTG